MSTKNSQAHTSNDRIYIGIACVCAAFFAFTFMQALGKLLTGRHDVIEIVFWRNLIASLPILFYILATKQTRLLKPSMAKPLASRVLIGNITMIFTFGGMQALPMSNATVLFFTSTLIIPVAAHFFLKERIGIHRWLAVFIGICGVILIARPSAELTMIGVVLALGAAFGQAFIQIILRYMKNENALTITFYFMGGGAVMIAPFMPWFFDMPNPTDALLLLMIGLSGGIGQYFLTLAFKYAPASLLSPFNYTGLIWATGFDIMIWGLIPSWHVYTGAAIIIASYMYILYREKKKRPKGREPADYSPE